MRKIILSRIFKYLNGERSSKGARLWSLIFIFKIKRSRQYNLKKKYLIKIRVLGMLIMQRLDRQLYFHDINLINATKRFVTV